MKIKDFYGRIKNISVQKYIVDWDKKRASNFQYDVKQFLRPFWQHHVVLEEFVIPSSRYRIDILNLSKQIALECVGRQHETYVQHFHKNASGYVSSYRRDKEKEQWVINNMNYTLVEIFPEDLPNLSRQWFMDKYNIDII